uniref:Integrase catalytic domain-containing protein n=1 Tax=Strongyloides papillosus TaxID=174720 RepID=A0A0N5BMJ3_STREA
MKHKEKRSPPILQPLTSAPLEKGFIDIGYDDHVNSFFIVLKDSYTNYPFASWLPNLKSKSIIKFLMSLQHQVGAFQHLQFDNQSCFTSQDTQTYLKSIGTAYSYSIPYQHESNGGAERLIRSIKSFLGRFFDLNEPKSQALYKTLMRLRQIPYAPRKGRFTKNKSPTPLQLMYNDESREYTHLTPHQILHQITPIFRTGFFKRRPDLNSEWENCVILSRINNRTYFVVDDNNTLHRRTASAVKITEEELDEETIKDLEKNFKVAFSH